MGMDLFKNGGLDANEGGTSLISVCHFVFAGSGPY